MRSEGPVEQHIDAALLKHAISLNYAAKETKCKQILNITYVN